MSNPTELPDLAEAVRKLVKAKGRFHTEQNYKELADALARYDARRAQPEGEAPQADVHKLDAAMSLLRVAAECDVDKISPAKLRNQVRESVADAAGRNGVGEEYIFADVYDQLTEMLEPWMFRDGRDLAQCPLPASVTESVEMLLEYFNRPAATLPPLCGAQHAESRDAVLEEAARVCDEIEADLFDAYKGRGKYEPFNPRRADVTVDGQSDGAGQCGTAIRKLKRAAQLDGGQEGSGS